MAGITDRPFRQLCRKFGAGLAFSEMITADKTLWMRAKTLKRADHQHEPSPIAIQIAGADPQQMAEAAQINVAQGADIIDINMGCPVKKVCHTEAGSALMKNEALVAKILEAVVNAVTVPVTLKTRLGWDEAHQNILSIAQLAEQAGVSALTIHGRTREQGYKGHADYRLIRQVKQTINIPVIANGDITTPQKAAEVLQYTQADAIMVGRGAQGRPWIFQQIKHYLQTGENLPTIDIHQIYHCLQTHLQALYQFYGEYSGCRMARKHIAWYLHGLPDAEQFKQKIFHIETTVEQFQAISAYFNQLTNSHSDIQLHSVYQF